MKALYTAATGMNAQQARIDNIANNLANVSTTGYKKSRATFEDLLYQQLPIGSASIDNQRPVHIEVGTGTRLVSVSRDFSNGDLTYTGNEFDLALGDRGFFLLEGPGGTERFTRDGHFIKNADGDLVTSAGLSLDPSINIPDDAQRVLVNADGTVQVEYEGETDLVTIGTVQLVDFVNPNGLRSVGGNLFVATPESGDPEFMDADDGFVNIQQGFTESSNVDVAEELITMIQAQRSFELSSKVIQTADEAMSLVNNLKR